MTQQPRATVPMVIGMTVELGQRVAGECGVVLATEDRDGPPLGALLWPRSFEYKILSQRPAAGTNVSRHESVIITYRRSTAQPGEAGDREPRRPRPSPGTLYAARHPGDAL